MVVQGKSKPDPIPTEDERRKAILEEFEKADYSVLLLALMYAQGYAMCGEDVTKAWTNAVQNTHLIETVYRKGYEDCEKDYAEKKRRDFYRKAIVDLKE